jgi:hypothetical protein
VLRVSPNKNRLVQVRRVGSRKLLDKARKETFLEWFAATCNVALSAAKAGVCDKTVYKHLLKDPAFEEAALRALRVGYFRLEARELQEAYRPAIGGHPHPAQAELESPSPSRGEGEYEVRVLDDAQAEEHFDPVLALHLLREHRRHLPGSADGRKNQRTTARSATNKEIAEALAKRLKGFGLRVSRGEGPPPHPHPHPRPHPTHAPLESPSPRGRGSRE